jgi:hypothetical protein
MAVKKAAAPKAVAKKEPRAKSDGNVKDAKPGKVKDAKPGKVTAKAAPKTNGEAKTKRRSPATQMICDLIMDNAKLPEAKKLTDSEIFAKVQAKHGLDDGKRVYVGWYRGQMNREGVKNVPSAHKPAK